MDRAQLLGKSTRPVVAVECPDLGRVYLRELSGAEMARLYTGERPVEEITQLLVAASLCDAEGARLLKPEDGLALYEAHPSRVLAPIVDEALRINRMTKAAVEEAKKA